MKTNKIRERTLEEVRNDLTAAEENLRNLKLRLVTSQLDKTSMIRQSKREIALLKTVLREHELGIRKLTVPGAAVEL